MDSPDPPNKFDAEIGARVRALREMQQISQDELGLALGVSGEKIQRYESGATCISGSCLIAMAKTLGVRLSLILGGAKDPLEGELIDAIGSPSRQAAGVAMAFDRITDPTVRDDIARLVETLGAPSRAARRFGSALSFRGAATDGRA